MNEEVQGQETLEQTQTDSGREFFGDTTPEDVGQPQGEGGGARETTAAERQEERREALSADQIRGAVAAGVRDAQPAAAPPQYSREELDRMFNVWNPTQEQVDQLLQGGEGALKSLVEMRNALTRQFGTLLQYQMEILRNEMGGRIAPMESFASEQAAAKDRAAFFEYAPDLQPFERLAQTVFFALKAEGFQAKDVDEAYQVLADRTRALIPVGANGSGATQSGGAQPTTRGTTRPARLASGSQAGGGGPSAPAAPYPGAEIWQD
jgi:hypothetical protein